MITDTEMCGLVQTVTRRIGIKSIDELEPRFRERVTELYKLMINSGISGSAALLAAEKIAMSIKEARERSLWRCKTSWGNACSINGQTHHCKARGLAEYPHSCVCDCGIKQE